MSEVDVWQCVARLFFSLFFGAGLTFVDMWFNYVRLNA